MNLLILILATFYIRSLHPSVLILIGNTFIDGEYYFDYLLF